ncbi:MAG TPA: class IV adenylate cyclase [Terriglobia bacterium]|nr:class IV adenylate cyclase [Terriglobia bacterium]
MKHPYEIEVKLKVSALSPLKRRLRELGFAVVHRRHFEGNDVFDFVDLRLRRSRALLRLRTAGRRTIVTFKGTPRPSARYKVRKEIETEVEDGARLRGIFKALGLRPVFRYEKYRTAYGVKDRRKIAGSPALLYDETPIGNYVELEGPRKWIDKVARQLGYRHKDYITASYATLYQGYCRKKGIQPGNMVFPK